MESITVKIGGTDHVVGYVGSKLAIHKSGEPHAWFYKVKPDSDYTYRIQKTQIKAHGGAEGLYKHFAECVTSNFAVDAWVVTPLEQIIKNVKKAN